MIQQLALETVFVGVAAAVVFGILHKLVRPVTLVQVVMVGFLAGAFLHLFFELVGLNRMYCDSGFACRR